MPAESTDSQLTTETSYVYPGWHLVPGMTIRISSGGIWEVQRVDTYGKAYLRRLNLLEIAAAFLKDVYWRWPRALLESWWLRIRS